MHTLTEARVGMEAFRVVCAVVIDEVPIDVPILDRNTLRPEPCREASFILQLSYCMGLEVERGSSVVNTVAQNPCELVPRNTRRY